MGSVVSVLFNRRVDIIQHTVVDRCMAVVVVAFVRPPDLNQARVNKCLIALVNRKIVRKDNSTVRRLYAPALFII